MNSGPARPAHCHAVVPCAGVGERAGTAGPKQYQPVGGRAVVAHTLSALAAVPAIDQIVVVLSPLDAQFEAATGPALAQRVRAVRRGGSTRAASVLAGLHALQMAGVPDSDWVLVHDAARCLLRPEWVERLIADCRADAVGGLLALPLADTLKAAVGDPPRAEGTPPRAGKWLAQTPQMFSLGLLRRALDAAGPAAAGITDEASAIEALGLKPLLVRGSAHNLKLTWPEDFALAEALLSLPARSSQASLPASPAPMSP